MKGHNGDYTNYSAGNPLVDFFSKAGSLFEKKVSYYGNEASAVDLFEPAFCVSKLDATKLAFWCRDIRGGAGNRSGFRKIINWLANNSPDWISANLHLVPLHGRWDDLISLCDTSLEKQALEFWAEAILRGDELACKWAPRQQKKHNRIASKLRYVLGVSPKQYRKLLVGGTNVVEQQMCARQWDKINFAHVPSVAMARYTKAFGKNAQASFANYKQALVKGETKVNSSALFPHDVYRTCINGDSLIAEEQFKALPNFFKTTDRVMAIADFSGSMGTPVSGSVTALDVASSLSLYCSDRVGQDNPFYRKFIPFSDGAEFFNWNGKSFAQTVSDIRYKLGNYYGGTNIASVFDLLLKTASFLNVRKDQMPNVLLILSDLQFNRGVSVNKTSVQSCLEQWEKLGYTKPKVIFWNLAGYAGSPVKMNDLDVGLVSGFSPAILKSVFEGEDFTPLSIMREAIEKYNVICPD